MSDHEETAKRLLPCEWKLKGDQPCDQWDASRPAFGRWCITCSVRRPTVAAALAQAEAKGVRMGLERAREIFAHELRPWQEIDAEIAKAGEEKAPA